ncbi:MAG: FAD-binding oxidoreductase [Gammaproteobacteria bacterium]|nr:FAD-binding oxidoreductase [Gammaproteobacteria bacterium]
MVPGGAVDDNDIVANELRNEGAGVPVSNASLQDILDRVGYVDSHAVADRATSFWNSAPMQAKAMVLPESADDIAGVLRHCNASGQSVITHGGLTNCVAAVEPGLDDLVLSTEKMHDIVEIDTVGGTAVVEAGAILQNVQETVASEGMYFPLDLGARGSCTIGGNIATNAGGINVLRYGMMRNLVLGLEVVLADGTVMSSMNRMLKNNAGYDMKQLFIGSEGTLGVVTRAVLRLFPQPASRQDALVAISSMEGVIDFLGMLQRDLAGNLSAFEIMWGNYYRAVTGENGHRPPLPREHPFYVVFQAAGSDPDGDAARFERVLGKALDAGHIADAVIPKSAAETRAIWEIRENFEPALVSPTFYLYDVSLPIRDMDAYVAAVEANVANRWPDGMCIALGHMADGNLHFFVAPGEPGDLHKASDECVYGPLKQYGGSVSAEHGIGLEKISWLPHSKSSDEIRLMRALKDSLDPNNVLNPGRVLGS